MNDSIQLFTIGFTKKGAKTFFESLQNAGVKRLLDIRLNNVSQLAGFAKKADLEYFLKTICDIDYIHLLDLAPTKEIVDEYKKNKGDWQQYEVQFLELIRQRKIEDKVSPDLIDGACFLCSEASPNHCHRRLVAEYLNQQWGNVDIQHL
ncbi:DUF488 domain-containing protein [Phormidium yuhuli AB48]|uniref:DUF488 domain-containing protein n=1 Tax=Phormidium yuhuli AB48 TaxID=2940671 RepID=A0ABY5AMU3_9CYAN|nr:DUF488 domain-containing protein [Phormidium yuhuli]USR90539.1 DUF488 domain-containing protein [Phormidium yuhuli AB48]